MKWGLYIADSSDASHRKEKREEKFAALLDAFGYSKEKKIGGMGVWTSWHHLPGRGTIEVVEDTPHLVVFSEQRELLEEIRSSLLFSTDRVIPATDMSPSYEEKS